MLKHRIRRIEALLNRCDLQRPQPPPRVLQTVQDVIDLLQEQVEAVRADRWAGTIEKARALAYLAGVARKAMEAGPLAARIDMLEVIDWDDLCIVERPQTDPFEEAIAGAALPGTNAASGIFTALGTSPNGKP